MMDLQTVSQVSPPMLKPLLVRLRKRLDTVKDQPAEPEDGVFLRTTNIPVCPIRLCLGSQGSQLLERLRQEDCKFKARLVYRMN